MLSRTELLHIIEKGEKSSVEFMRDAVQPEDLAKKLVAFSNFEGGMVLLGVEDDGEISGIKRNESKEWVMNACRDKIDPPMLPRYEVISMVDGENDVAVVRVPRGRDVYALWHHDVRRYLIRVGTQSRDASRQELGRLLQRRAITFAELQPISDTKIDDLDYRRLRNYFSYVRTHEDLNEFDHDFWLPLLTDTQIMVNDDVTLCGMLLFGQNPSEFVPYATIDAVAFNELEGEYIASKRISLRGPLTPLLNENNELKENGLVEQALAFVQRSVSTIRGKQVSKPIYPNDVLIEAIVNAVTHRDYLMVGFDIKLEVYPDRLELTSPGLPIDGLTPETLRTGAHCARNQLLTSIMRDYGYMGSLGMGIPRKIVQGMLDHNGTEPDLVIMARSFMLRLYAGTLST